MRLERVQKIVQAAALEARLITRRQQEQLEHNRQFIEKMRELISPRGA